MVTMATVCVSAWIFPTVCLYLDEGFAEEQGIRLAAIIVM